MIGGNDPNYNIYEMPPIAVPLSSYGQYLISSVLPDGNMHELLLKCTIISDIEKNKLKGIKDDDNPILVFFRLKDF